MTAPSKGWEGKNFLVVWSTPTNVITTHNTVMNGCKSELSLLQVQCYQIVGWQENGEGLQCTPLPESLPGTGLSKLIKEPIVAARVPLYLYVHVLLTRAVTKISSCQVNTTNRWGIIQLGISFGYIFLLFSYEKCWRLHS